jgi:DNA-3-methyladenine glycosylase I
MKRCHWAEGGDTAYIAYHDEEWGVPVYNDQKLFEFIILEGAQAGLSWKTILMRREGYRKAFKNYDAKKVARMDDSDVERLMHDTGIIRNRLKIKSTISNAQIFLKIQKEFGSFSNYMWSYVHNKPIRNKWKSHKELPAVTELAEKISKDLKKRGFKFFGPTICYAHMQATGMVNDHTFECFRYKQLL